MSKKFWFSWLAVATISLIAVSVVRAVEPLPNGFRKATWGMTKSQVRTDVGDELFKEDERSLAYKGSADNKEALIMYRFAEDQLVRGSYLFMIHHTNKTDFITDFDELKNVLTEKYDRPSSERVIWKNDLYKDQPSQWGMAVSVGHLIYFTEWKSKETTITLALRGENYQIHLVVQYESNLLGYMEGKENKKKKDAEF